jgi:Tol biopolymer transport system component
MAQVFDANRLELRGKPTPVADGIESNVDVIDSYFSVSANGTLAYWPTGQVISYTQLTWFDRAGKQLGTLGLPRDHHPALSPDGKRVAVMRYFNNGSSSNIWVLDLARGAATRVTFSSAMDESPIWSPDGSRIVFTSNRDGRYNLYQKSSNGAGEEKLVFKSDEDKWITDWSSDGRFLVYNTLTENADIWVLPLEGDRKPIPFLQTRFGEALSRLSPDGHWIVYWSNDSGRSATYVRPFGWRSSEGNEAPSERWQISTQGGGFGQWRRDGKELFYLGPGGKIIAVAVKTGVSKGRPTFEAGVPKPLLAPPAVEYDSFAVTADGLRFLLNVPISEEKSRSFTLVLNWTALLKR